VLAVVIANEIARRLALRSAERAGSSAAAPPPDSGGSGGGGSPPGDGPDGGRRAYTPVPGEQQGAQA
jgi:simple sugar transport system permease protein